MQSRPIAIATFVGADADPESLRKPDARRPLTADRRELAARYLPLARALSKPYRLRHPHWYEEFESAAGLALVQAAQSFDPGRNVKFATFARFRIVGALRDALRTMIADGCTDPDARDDESLDPARHDHAHATVDGAPPVGRDSEALEEVERLLKPLPPGYRTVMLSIYLDGLSPTATARALGYSKSRVTAIHNQSLAMLAGEFTPGGERSRCWS